MFGRNPGASAGSTSPAAAEHGWSSARPADAGGLQRRTARRSPAGTAGDDHPPVIPGGRACQVAALAGQVAPGAAEAAVQGRRPAGAGAWSGPATGAGRVRLLGRVAGRQRIEQRSAHTGRAVWNAGTITGRSRNTMPPKAAKDGRPWQHPGPRLALRHLARSPPIRPSATRSNASSQPEPLHSGLTQGYSCASLRDRRGGGAGRVVEPRRQVHSGPVRPTSRAGRVASRRRDAPAAAGRRAP